MATEVVDVPDAQRYELRVDGVRAGLIDYVHEGNTVALTHTEVDAEFQNRGLASVLVRGALDHIRDGTDLRVVPQCPYVATWITRHPDYADLTTR